MKLAWKKKLNAVSTTPTLACTDVSVSVSDDFVVVGTPERKKSAASSHVSSPTSLGSGHYSPSDGTVVEFFPPLSGDADPSLPSELKEPPKPEPLKIVESTLTDSTGESISTSDELKEPDEGDAFPLAPPAASFLRHSSSFLRVTDLLMDLDMDLSSHDTESIPHYHCSSVDPPPGIPHDPREKWVALGGDGEAATPIAPWAVHGLTQTGLATLLDENMWVPDAKTSAILQSKSLDSWERNTFASSSVTSATRKDDPSQSDHVLIWSGTFRHGLYGSDLPAIRSAALIPMRPQDLFDLLVDSSRVREYNSMSLGRTDLWTLPVGNGETNDDPTIVTKIMRSESRPPLLRKILQFTSIFHARHYEDGYLLVTRAVEHPSTKNTSSVVVSEILLGVNVIRPHTDNSCLLLTVNHIRSPMVPMYIAKRLGLQAAVNFVHDLRRCA